MISCGRTTTTKTICFKIWKCIDLTTTASANLKIWDPLTSTHPTWRNLENCSKRTRRPSKRSRWPKLMWSLCIKRPNTFLQLSWTIYLKGTWCHQWLTPTQERYLTKCLKNFNFSERGFPEESYKGLPSLSKTSGRSTGISATQEEAKAIAFLISVSSSTLIAALKGAFSTQKAVKTTKVTCSHGTKNRCFKTAWSANGWIFILLMRSINFATTLMASA